MKQIKYDEGELDRFLGEIETVAMYIRDKIIKRKYAYEMFDTIMVSIRKDKQIQSFINKSRVDDDELFSNMIWLNDKIDDWNK